ncbi:TatD family hydrolase [Thalassotalea mangrovi]|uniref:YchF/TatD family DNA exonuclease n=1 Tax=Thalassotalea mangrovi TaxID=2572245 RepID=A0A4U1B6U1_9GAMM|nr:TatD family hydrolase [Thalassotalea mangrovi]TKB46284.1 YchF/TatD family DNA exonuclease [Thalassotalea mangrovi]
MTTSLVDIGVNLTNSRFDKDRDLVIARARAAGVKEMVITGTSVDESQAALRLCEHDPDLYCTAGVHPHDADNVSADYLQQLTRLCSNDKVKAVGECGLDFNRNFSTPANQKRVFTEHLALAAELQLPLFLHQRDAFDTWQAIINEQRHALVGGVSHCFTGNLQELKQVLDMGFYVGITGWVCDPKRGQELYDIVRYIPLDRLLIETDAPYLTPKNIRPRPKSSRNEPGYLPHVADTLASAMAIDKHVLITKTTENARRLFQLNGDM